MFRAILFDLDGTMIENDMESFLNEYFKTLAPRIQPFCKNGDFVKAMYASSRPLFKQKRSKVPLINIFYQEMSVFTGLNRQQLEEIFFDYYENEYKSINVVKPFPGALDCVQKAADIADILVVATVPIFPSIAIEIRMQKGGIQGIHFDLITSIEVMHSSKPHKTYFQEILKKINCKPQECLMIGNDHIDDLAASKAGINTFLVTEFQKNKGRGKYKPDREGTMEDLSTYLSLLS